MAKIISNRLVGLKLKRLLDSLITEGYFSYIENAVAYVKEIERAIDNIDTSIHYPTRNNKYGAWYIRYKANKHTTWYITFDIQDEVYLVKNIINNHTPDYPEFIRDIE